MTCSCHNLQSAVIYCCVSCVHRFIDQVHVKDYYGRTALFDVVNLECLTILFENGAQVKDKDYRGQTPFENAMDSYEQWSEYPYKSMYLDKMAVLLEHGADVSNIVTINPDIRNVIETYYCMDIKEPDSN